MHLHHVSYLPGAFAWRRGTEMVYGTEPALRGTCFTNSSPVGDEQMRKKCPGFPGDELQQCLLDFIGSACGGQSQALR